MSHYDHSHDHLLLFDGVCHLCDAGVRFILQRDPSGKIKFAPIQSQLGRELYTRHGLDPESPNTMLFITPHGAFQASDAALEIARTLGGVWKLALIFKPLPRALRDASYYFIARNRYRWFGKDESCMMPTAELKARVVTEFIPPTSPKIQNCSQDEQVVYVIPASIVAPIGLGFLALCLAFTISILWLAALPCIYVASLCAQPNLNLADGCLAWMTIIAGCVVMCIIHPNLGEIVVFSTGTSYAAAFLERIVRTKPMPPNKSSSS